MKNIEKEIDKYMKEASKGHGSPKEFRKSICGQNVERVIRKILNQQ